jgi:hypothetical protein
MARDDGDSNGSATDKRTKRTETPEITAGQHSLQLDNRSMLTTAALIGVAALIQPELLVGMAIGAGVAMASNWLPDLVGGTVRPMVKTAIKAGYAAASMAREVVAEASESVQDIVAEARAEHDPIK